MRVYMTGGNACTDQQVALWRSGTLCDVTVMVEGQAFSLHKFVLAGASGYFRAILTSGVCMRDGGNELQLSDTSAACFAACVQWLYSGTCTLSDETMLPSLLEQASFLQIPDLLEAAASQLMCRITTEHVNSIWDLGERYAVPSLVKAAREEALAQFADLAASESFLQLDADRLGQILADDSLNAPEDVVFEAIVRWLTKSCHSLAATDSDTAQALFGHVRFARMSLEFIEQRVEQEPLLVNRHWGGWILACAFRDVVYSKDTALARKRRIRGLSVEWSDLRVGMRVRMLESQSKILEMFENGKAPGATKPIGLGTLAEHLAPLVGREHVIQELLPEKRGVRIADGGSRWMLPYTAFVTSE